MEKLYVNGYVNRHNNQIWGFEQPDNLYTHSESQCVCGNSCDDLIRLYLFREYVVKADHYL